MTRHDIGWRHLVADSELPGGRRTVTSHVTVAGAVAGFAVGGV